MHISLSRLFKGLSLLALTMFVLSALVLISARAVGASGLSDSLELFPSNANIPLHSFNFNLVPSSPNINACLPHATGSVSITPHSLNDTMNVHVSGLVPNTGYDLFVIQLPNKPFGVSWYQSDLQTDSTGAGSVTVEGIFNKETFSISTGGTTTFGATHQYHLGLWFNDPNVPVQTRLRTRCNQPDRYPI